MEKSRDMVYFLESFHSDATRKTYEFHVKKFLEWTGRDFESIKFLSKLEVTNLLCDYALYKKKRVSPNSLLCSFFSFRNCAVMESTHSVPNVSSSVLSSDTKQCFQAFLVFFL